MPTPTVHQYLGESAFNTTTSDEQSPETMVFYATNRPGSGPPDERTYRNGAVDELQLGRAIVHFGDRRMTWRDLVEFSTNRERKDKIPLHLDNTTEIATLPGKGTADFSRQINRALAKQRRLDGIDMQYSPEKRPFDFMAHGHWYANEWVSSDVIIQFFTHERPDRRGLKKKPGSEAWYFPADYPETLKRVVKELE